jgi:hypothetical protein
MILECKHVGITSPAIWTIRCRQRPRNWCSGHQEHSEICSAILDSTRNILILAADDRIFELPVGFSERLHARLAQQIDGSSREPGKD